MGCGFCRTVEYQLNFSLQPFKRYITMLVVYTSLVHVAHLKSSLPSVMELNCMPKSRTLSMQSVRGYYRGAESSTPLFRQNLVTRGIQSFRGFRTSTQKTALTVWCSGTNLWCTILWQAKKYRYFDFCFVLPCFTWSWLIFFLSLLCDFSTISYL